MSFWTVIDVIDILLWVVMAASTFYVFFFSLASLLPHRSLSKKQSAAAERNNFLVLFPAYHEDAVILNSVKTFLQQDYPDEYFQVAVVSDHMQADTNRQLAVLPVTLLQPTFDKSSKAKALQYAVSHLSPLTSHLYNYVVILDADNVVGPDFLTLLNVECQKGYAAIQCHRTAKNVDNDIAALDGISEEINNSIFRRGHNRIGLSSALIGSGMCFGYYWFRDHVGQLDSAVEDRELEALLLKQGVYIHYAEDIYVMDEKVSNSDNFQRQRLRWMTGQVQAFCRMLPYIPKAILTGNINYIDKTIQQALIPRSILLLLVPLFTLVATALSLLSPHQSSLKWWLLLACLILAFIVAIPSRLRTRAIFTKAVALPGLVWKMLCNVFHINIADKEFLHTTHHT